MRNLLVVSLAGAAAFALAAAVWSAREWPVSLRWGSVRSGRVAPVPGARAPELGLTDQTGRKWTVADLRGRRTLLWFFCGCVVCRDLGRECARGGPEWRGAQVLVVTALDPREARSLQQATGLLCPILADPFADAAGRYRAAACPRGFIIDGDGLICYASESPITDTRAGLGALRRELARW